MRVASGLDRAGGVGCREGTAGEESVRGSFEGASRSFPSLLPPARAIAAGLGMDHWASSSRARGEGAGRKILAVELDQPPLHPADI